jgi:hypothetical protein
LRRRVDALLRRASKLCSHRKQEMFKFGFGECDADNFTALAHAANSPDHVKSEEAKAWLVERPQHAQGNVGPDAFDVVEMADGAVRLRKCIALAPPPSLAPESSDLEPGSYEGGYKLWECASPTCTAHRSRL